ncbi:purine-nucleoside phosphorylase [Oscillospiraceae bacterium 38-13]
MIYTLDYFQKSADFLKAKFPATPEIAIVLGSCLGPFAREIQDPVTVDYASIPNFLLSTVESHAGKLIFGTAAGRRVVCMSGRFHSYEGYTFEQLVIPIRVLKLLGVRAVILTNAAGAVNTEYRPGDVMVLSSHIKLNGDSPLRGPNVEEFGPRFFDTSRMYTPALRKLALDRAKESPLRIHEGTYMFFPGPQFETPAEIRAARALGADAVGMSTVTEALTAAHCGLPLLALSVMTNMAAGVLDQPLSGEEVDRTAEMISGPFSEYLKSILAAISYRRRQPS